MKNNKLRQKNISIGTIPENTFFLEYSVQQRCLHIDTLKRILEHNRDLCKRRTETGYVIIDGPMEYDKLFKSMKEWTVKLGLVLSDLGSENCYIVLPSGKKVKVK